MFHVAVDWLDAYRADDLNRIVALHIPDAVIECACGGPKTIRGREAIVDYWRLRFIESPALGLEALKIDDGTASVSYRTRSGTVQATLDITNDGLISRCRCGPANHAAARIDWVYPLLLAGALIMTVGALSILLFAM